MEEWTEEDIQMTTREGRDLLRDGRVKPLKYDDNVKKKAECILGEMENSYQKLEKVLKVFNGINRSS